ncbi:MAG: pyridoxamine 5'-phosphate oxidase family protein [Candidatus Aminicenantes bacterium]
MSNEILEKITGYLVNHEHLNLGTVTAEGAPIVHTVAYVSDGATIYFVTHKESRKAQNISSNSAVAYTVDDDDYEDWTEIIGIQGMGKASLLEDKEELEKVQGLMMKKFPQMANLPPDPNMVFYKVEPTEIYYLDNTVSFGHRDRVEF